MNRETFHTERSMTNNKPKQKGNGIMNLQRCTLLVLGLVLALSGTAGAVDTTWKTPGNSGNWSTAANWDNGVPGPTTNVFIDAETGSGSTVTLDASPTVASVTISAGDTLKKDNSASSRILTVTAVSGVINNAGTIVHDQGSSYLRLDYSISTLNANTGTIRADGGNREIRLSNTIHYKLDNTGGLIEAVNGGTISFPKGGYITGGRLKTDSSSIITLGMGNGEILRLTGVVVTNAGTCQMLGTATHRYTYFLTSGGLANEGTTKVSISSLGTGQGMEFYTDTTLNNSGTFTIENIRTSTAATSASYLDLKAGSSLINSGTIEVKSLDNTYGTAQLRSAIDLSSSGTITVDGSKSSIQMSDRTLTQTAGLLVVTNGGSVVAATVAINGGTLAGNGSITGNVTLASGVTRAWSYADGVAGAMTVSGTLTLPATATVSVSGSGAFPETATLFTATELDGADSLSGWTVTGAPGYSAKKVDNSVVLAKSGGGTIILLR